MNKIIEMNQIEWRESEELSNCYTQLTNSMTRIFEANGENHTQMSKMLDEMASKINMFRVSRYGHKTDPRFTSK